MEAKHDTISKLRSFEALFHQGYKSQVIDQALNKLAGLELAKAKRELDDIEAKISEFEIRYNMQSVRISLRGSMPVWLMIPRTSWNGFPLSISDPQSFIEFNLLPI